MGGHRPRAISGEHRAWLLQRVEGRDFTLRGLVVELAELKVDDRTVWNFVHSENLSFKQSMVAGERDRPDVAIGAANGSSTKTSSILNAWSSSTWTKTNMAPLRGWTTRQKSQRKSAVRSLEYNDVLGCCATIASRRHSFSRGPIDSESFQIYVQKVLVPTLRRGDIVIMDNLGSHKSKAMRRLIRAAGARLLSLPKYSPDLNPIEQVFAKLK
jgi:hypothetical protein